jgi:pyruvate-ferredoxin/flavodoxin oxidoreductase
MPGIPYTTNARGFGPAWTNSLFENNAELCLGLALSVKQQRARLREQVAALAAQAAGDLRAACDAYLAAFDDFDASRTAADALIAALEADGGAAAAEILAARDQHAKKTFWMYGGDGWAYDIGFGGLDHVIASGENVNVLVVDTEVYSNTGGQSSKATRSARWRSSPPPASAAARRTSARSS